MRKRYDEVFDDMDRESIIENLNSLNEVKSSGLNLETNDLRNRLRFLERICSTSRVSNEQRLLHSDIRHENISLLRENLETSDGIRDELRIFKGDSPARQF